MFLFSTLLACADSAEDDIKVEDDMGADDAPLGVTGWNEDEAIALGDADSQGEPSVVALPDGTVIAAWMSQDGYSLYIRYSISKDGGKSWSDAAYIDKDRYGYQNDPVLVYGGGYVYFTWLAVEGSSYNKANVYCVDSTDGGDTWSDKVQLTESGTFNDRQWMAADDRGYAVVTWDKFEGNYDESQEFAESEGGCAGFGEENGETVFEGILLNGVPAIDADGGVWISRHQFTSRGVNIVVQKKEEGGWGDEIKLHEGSYPGYFQATATADRDEERDDELPENWRELLPPGQDEYPIGAYAMLGEELKELQRPPWARGAREMRGGWRELPPMMNVSGDYSGTYSPVLQPMPDGTLVATYLDLKAGSDDEAEVWFARFDGKETVEAFALVDSDGTAQQEPWITVDPFGGIHAIWYDAREGKWRLRGATSVDGGETFEEFEIGDNLMKKGFDDYDATSWLGHFQGVSAYEGGVVTVFCDNSEGNASRVMSDFATLKN